MRLRGTCSLHLRRRVLGAELRAVTVKTSIPTEDFLPAVGHSRFRHRIDIGTFLVHLRIEMSDLVIRNHGETHPGECERSEQSKKKRKQTFHKCTSSPSASTGLRKVGTLGVRPRPKSMRPK